MRLSEQTARKGALIIAFAGITARVLGLVLEIAILKTFGASWVTDALFVVSVIPFYFATLLASALVYVFIPVFSEYRFGKSEEEAWKLAGQVGTVFTMALVSCAVLVCVAGSGLVVRLLAPGFAPRTHDLAVKILIALSPAFCFTALNVYAAGILNSYRHFKVPAVTPVILNATMILFLLALAGRYGVMSLAYGAAAGSFLACGLTIGALSKKGSLWSLRVGAHPVFKRMAAGLGPILVGMLALQLNVAVDRMLASQLAEGTIAALECALMIIFIFPDTIARSLENVFFPGASEMKAKEDTAALGESFNKFLNVLIFAMVPITVFVAVTRTPVVRLIFERGAFDANATLLASRAVLFYSLGLVPFSLTIILRSAFYAHGRPKVPLVTDVVSIAVNISLNLLFIRLFSPGWKHAGLAFATSIAALANTTAMAIVLAKHVIKIDFASFTGSALKTLLSAAAAGLAALALVSFCEGRAFAQYKAGNLLEVAAALAVSLLFYAGTAALLRSRELGIILRR